MTIRYVNTASTAGGDGTTNATTGANRAFATLAEAETALQATLTEDMEILCAGATADARTTFDGWVPGSFRIYVKGNPDDAAGVHAGIWDVNKYRISAASGTLATLEIIEDNVTASRIQLTTTHVDGMAIGRAGPVGLATVADSLVLKGSGTTSSSIGAAYADLNNANVRVKNCIAYDWVVGIYVRQEAAGGGDSFTVNNTVHSCSQGIRGHDNGGAATYIQAWNNLSVGNTSDWIDTGGAFDLTNSGHNAFRNTGAACPGSTDIDLSTYLDADIFVDAANDNFHLLTTGSAYALIDNDGVGPDSNAEVTIADIDGHARSGTTTSVGADVIVAGGTIYTRTLADSVSADDAPIRGVQAFRHMPQDVLAVAEMLARSQMHGRATTDSISISEDVRRAALLFRKQNDSADASDSALRFVQMFRRLLDDVGVTDSLAVTLTLGGVIIVTRILQDGLDVRDTVLRAVHMYRLESQAVDVADNSWYSASIVRGLIDTLSVAETAARAMMRGRVVSDSVEAADLAVRYALLYRLLHDDADASDSLASTITYYQTLIGFVLMSLRNEPVIMALDEAQPIIMEMRNV